MGWVARRHSLDHLDMGNGRGPQALDLCQARLAGVEDARKRAELAQQGLGQCLGVAPRDGQLQGKRKQFVILKRVAADLEEAFAHALAMTGMVIGGSV